MEALHRWSPELNHAVLLFLCPFHFLMAMRERERVDSIVIIAAGKLCIFWWFTATYFPYLSFFLYFRLITTRINSQFLVLTPAVLLILFTGHSPKVVRAFFGSFSSLILGLSEVFIALMMFLEIWSPSVVICWPRASASFSEQFPIFVRSGSWIGACFQSFTMHWKLFWSSILIISTDREIDCKDINGYKICVCSSSLLLLQPCQALLKKWPWLARRILSINPEQMKWKRIISPPHFLYDFLRKTWHVLLTDYYFIFSLSLLREILGNIYIVIACFPGFEVTNFEINHICLIKLFFYMIKKPR